VEDGVTSNQARVSLDGAFEVRLLPLLLMVMQPDGSIDRAVAERLARILEPAFPDVAQRLQRLIAL
jgi:predicted ABC-type transport system involved in lysophospholipase L1 biosynthesis ATPase subunit